MAATGIVFGGLSPEHDISILTGLQAARTLRDAGDDVAPIYWGKDGRWWRVPVDSEAASFLTLPVEGAIPLDLVVPGGFVERRRLRDSPVDLDVVLNCCHGGPGEDGTLGGLLGLAGLPSTGPHPEVCALLMDKLASGAVMAALDVATIPTVLADEGLDEHRLPPRPWVAKPRYGGSSIGVEVDVDDLSVVLALGRTGTGQAGMLVQPYLKGWEDLNIAVRTANGIELSPIERPLRSGDGAYSYEDKYLTGTGMDAAPRELPARLPEEVVATIERAARLVTGEFPLTGAPRLDFLWDGDQQVVLNEVNAIPGAWGNHLWRAGGVHRLQLYRDLIVEARGTGPRRPQWVATSDGRALRSSGSIASKLA